MAKHPVFPILNPMRTLVFIRHGKAQPKLWSPDTAEDHTGRHLEETGKQQSRLVGSWLQARGIMPDHIICSTATRTRETCATVLEHMQLQNIPTTFDDAIYYRDVADIIACIKRAPAQAKTLFVVGHNPTLPQTAQFVDGGQNPVLHDQLYRQFGLAATALLDVNDEWGAIKPASGVLQAVFEPENVMAAASSQ